MPPAPSSYTFICFLFNFLPPKFPPETSVFSEQYSWVFFFLLDNFRPPFTWFFRRTCIGLCVHFLYISSILGELVLVFWFFFERVRNTFRLNFDFSRYLTETVTWERGQTTTAKPIRPRRFLVLKLNQSVCTIFRFLNYFWFFIITEPN